MEPTSSQAMEQDDETGGEPMMTSRPPTLDPSNIKVITKKLDFIKQMQCVVKLEVTHCEPWYQRPWSRLKQSRSHSTAFVYDVDKKYLLTCAHCVEDCVVIQVRKRNVSKAFTGELLGLSVEMDIALVTVESTEFWTDVHALPLEDDAVDMGDMVEVVGFPRGGEKLCLTQGIVSRVDLLGLFLSLQIDAAINSGNSGGPALRGGQRCVGIAYKKASDSKADNIGYCIPISLVKHFLEDFERNKKYTGVPELSFMFQPLENDGMRKGLGMQDDQSGVRVTSILPWSPANDLLEVGDIVMKINGCKVENSAKVEFHDGEFISLHYLLSERFPGNILQLEVFRSGAVLSLEYQLPPIQPLIPRKPENLDYVVYGGLVFLPLSEKLASQRKKLGVPPSSMSTVVANIKSRIDEEVVVLAEILRHTLNLGLTWRTHARILKVNGTDIVNIRQLMNLLGKLEDEWVTLEFDDLNQQFIIFNRAAEEASRAEILSSNNIPSWRSLVDPA